MLIVIYIHCILTINNVNNNINVNANNNLNYKMYKYIQI